MRTRRQPKGFFRAAIDRWVHRAAERASDPTIGVGVSETSPDLGKAVDAQLRVMLGDLFDRAPSFAQALAGYARALDEDRVDVSRGLLQWLAGDSHVAAGIKKYADLRGAFREDGALPMLAGLVTVLEQIGVRLTDKTKGIPRSILMPTTLAQEIERYRTGRRQPPQSSCKMGTCAPWRGETSPTVSERI